MERVLRAGRILLHWRECVFELGSLSASSCGRQDNEQLSASQRFCMSLCLYMYTVKAQEEDNDQREDNHPK